MQRGQRTAGWVMAATALHLSLVVWALLVRRADAGVASTTAQLLPQWVWPGLALVALAGAAGWRKWWLAALNLTLGALALVHVAGFSVGTPGRATQGETSLRVLVWNTGDRLVHARALERAIEAQRPDLVCLCEIRGLQWYPGYMAEWPRVVVSDVGVFTRLPVVRAEEVGRRSLGGRHRSWLSCTLQTGAGPLEVLVAHAVGRPAGRDWGAVLAHPGAWLAQVGEVQREQAGLLEQCLAPPERLSLLVGDFNSPPAGVVYRRLSRHMVDAWATTRKGLGLTFVARRRVPLWRLDYVWCGGGARPLRTRLLPGGPSDHRALVVDVALPGRDD